jgi:hypothetical protein
MAIVTVYVCIYIHVFGFICMYIHTHIHVCVAIVSVLPALSALDTIQLPRQIPRQYEDRHTVVRAHIYSRMKTHVVRGHTQYGKLMI